MHRFVLIYMLIKYKQILRILCNFYNKKENKLLHDFCFDNIEIMILSTKKQTKNETKYIYFVSSNLHVFLSILQSPRLVLGLDFGCVSFYNYWGSEACAHSRHTRGRCAVMRQRSPERQLSRWCALRRTCRTFFFESSIIFEIREWPML